MDPFKNMQDWKKNLDSFFGDDFWGEFDGILKPQIPQINIYQSDNELLCIINAPGIDDLNKIDIYVDYTQLEIKGVIHLDVKAGKIINEEILQGAFERKIDLPFPVRGDKINATYGNGLVFIQLHRLISQKSNKYKVKIRETKEK